MIYNFVFNSLKGSGLTQNKTFNVNFTNLKEGEYKCSFNFQSMLMTPAATTYAKSQPLMIYMDVGQSKVQETKILNSYTSTGQTINITNTQSNIYSITSTSITNNSFTIAVATDDLFPGRTVYISGIIGNLAVGYYQIGKKISSTEYTLTTTTGILINQIDATGAIFMTSNTITVDNTAGLYDGQAITIAGTTQNGIALGANTIDAILSPTTISIGIAPDTVLTGSTTTLSITGVNVINNYGFQLSKYIGMGYWSENTPRVVRAYMGDNPDFSLDVKPTFNQITVSLLDNQGALWYDATATPFCADWVLVLSMELVD
jgi:hypothetical protein